MAGLRVEGDSDDVTAIRDVGHRSLPDLASHGRAEVDLAVEVLVGDPGEELVQSRSGAGSDDQRAVDDGDVDLGLLLQTRLRRERPRDSHRQAVSPSLDACSHSSLRLYKVYTGVPSPVLRSVSERLGRDRLRRKLRRYRSGADGSPRDADRPRRKPDAPDSERTVPAGLRETQTSAGPDRPG